MSPGEGRPNVSLVIRAYNEERHLPALFRALENQVNANFEVILVDSGSMDGSREIAANSGARVIKIESHDFTFGYSLNVGIEVARGAVIAIASAHTIPCNPNWLECLSGHFEEDDVAMVYGRQLGVSSSKFSECEDFRRTYGARAVSHRSSKFFANNANSAVRRELWKRRPFDEALPGLEDMDWAKYWADRDYRIVYEPDASLLHVHEETWSQVRHRYYREAVAAKAIGIRGSRNAVTEATKEAFLTAADLLRNFFPGDNPVAKRRGWFGRTGEIIAFRANKGIGTVRGLLERPNMSGEKRKDLFFGRDNLSVVVKGAHQAAVESRAIPQARPGEVIIRVHTVAVCATDLEIFEGRLGYYKDGRASYPIVPGHEFSGEVVAVGTKVSNCREGDPVVAECIQGCGICRACRLDRQINCSERKELGVMGLDGGYAEFVATPSRFVHRLPPDLDLRTASLVEPVAVILKAFRRVQAFLDDANEAQRCGVVGAGPLGHICAQILQELGHDVVGFDREPNRLGFLSRVGIEVATSLDDLENISLVFELTGDAEALEQVVEKTPAGATIVLIGLPYGERRFNFEKITAMDKAVIGSVGSSGLDFDAAIEMLPRLDLAAYMHNIFPLSRFRDAWDRSREAEVLKVMIDPRIP